MFEPSSERAELGVVADGTGGAEQGKPHAGIFRGESEIRPLEPGAQFREQRQVRVADQVGAENLDPGRVQLREDTIKFGLEEAGVLARRVGLKAKRETGFVVDATQRLRREQVEGGEVLAEADQGIYLVETGERGRAAGPRFFEEGARFGIAAGAQEQFSFEDAMPERGGRSPVDEDLAERRIIAGLARSEEQAADPDLGAGGVGEQRRVGERRGAAKITA